MKIKTIFFGTHEFAVTILEGLLKSPEIEVVQVITQPDEPVGRRQILTPPPVKILAQKHSIPVDQPSTLKNYHLNIQADIFIVAQYGKIIPKHIIETPPHGTLNVHTSLLPKYRGASPIQTAIMHGETETGVTIMKMDEGMDTGPILLHKKIKIEADDTYHTLNEKLAELGKTALLEALPLYINGALQPVPQNDTQATYTKLLSREDGRVEWERSAKEIYNLYRGLTPWPGIWTLWGEKRLKLIEIKKGEGSLRPGLVEIKNGQMKIGCQEGCVEVVKIQPEGKGVMEGKVFLNGYKEIEGSVLN